MTALPFDPNIPPPPVTPVAMANSGRHFYIPSPYNSMHSSSSGKKYKFINLIMTNFNILLIISSNSLCWKCELQSSKFINAVYHSDFTKRFVNIKSTDKLFYMSKLCSQWM